MCVKGINFTDDFKSNLFRFFFDCYSKSFKNVFKARTWTFIDCISEISTLIVVATDRPDVTCRKINGNNFKIICSKRNRINTRRYHFLADLIRSFQIRLHKNVVINLTVDRIEIKPVYREVRHVLVCIYKNNIIFVRIQVIHITRIM